MSLEYPRERIFHETVYWSQFVAGIESALIGFLPARVGPSRAKDRGRQRQSLLRHLVTRIIKGHGRARAISGQLNDSSRNNCSGLMSNDLSDGVISSRHTYAFAVSSQSSLSILPFVPTRKRDWNEKLFEYPPPLGMIKMKIKKEITVNCLRYKAVFCTQFSFWIIISFVRVARQLLCPIIFHRGRTQRRSAS